MDEESREIAILYRGQDFAADRQLFLEAVQAIEHRHLPYFIGRPGIFEDDVYERLKTISFA